MNYVEGTWRNISELNLEYKQGYFAFQLSGRLGNQLLGLSDAFLINKITGRRPLLLLYENQISDFLLQFGKDDWFDVFQGSFSRPIRLFLGQPLSDLENLSRLNQGAIDGFQGFTRSHAIHELSGLLCQQMVSQAIGVSAEERDDTVTVTIRRGDYLRNPHLGVLPLSYYKKALSLLERNEKKISDVTVFCDSLESIEYVATTWLGKVGQLKFTEQASQDWIQIFLSKYCISANSTFSYSARLGKLDKTVLPFPFYLRVQSNFIPNSTWTVSHCRNPFTRYHTNRLRSYFQ
jgi:hypothetical protein